MSVSATVTGIQTVNATISGITSAPTALPGSPTTASMPLVIVIPGPCEWEPASDGWGHQFRTYYVRFYVNPITQDVAADGGYQDCLTLIQAVGDKYLTDTTFGGVVNTVRLDDGLGPPITDGGVRSDMTWGPAGQPPFYWGFEFQIITKETETW